MEIRDTPIPTLDGYFPTLKDDTEVLLQELCQLIVILLVYVSYILVMTTNLWTGGDCRSNEIHVLDGPFDIGLGGV